jgi:hypothetical protein
MQGKKLQSVLAVAKMGWRGKTEEGRSAVSVEFALESLSWGEARAGWDWNSLRYFVHL